MEYVDLAQVVEYLGNTGYAKKITCKLCGEVVYSVSDQPTKVEIERELDGFVLHFNLRHDCDVDFVKCSNPECGKKH